MGVLVFVFVYFIIIITYISGAVYCSFWPSLPAALRSIPTIFKIRNPRLSKRRSGTLTTGVAEGEWLHSITERRLCPPATTRRGQNGVSANGWWNVLSSPMLHKQDSNSYGRDSNSAGQCTWWVFRLRASAAVHSLIYRTSGSFQVQIWSWYEGRCSIFCVVQQLALVTNGRTLGYLAVQ